MRAMDRPMHAVASIRLKTPIIRLLVESVSKSLKQAQLVLQTGELLQRQPPSRTLLLAERLERLDRDPMVRAHFSELEPTLIHELADLWPRNAQQDSRLSRCHFTAAAREDDLETSGASIHDAREPLRRPPRKVELHLVALAVKSLVQRIGVASQRIGNVPPPSAISATGGWRPWRSSG